MSELKYRHLNVFILFIINERMGEEIIDMIVMYKIIKLSLLIDVCDSN